MHPKPWHCHESCVPKIAEFQDLGAPQYFFRNGNQTLNPRNMYVEIQNTYWSLKIATLVDYSIFLLSIIPCGHLRSLLPSSNVGKKCTLEFLHTIAMQSTLSFLLCPLTKIFLHTSESRNNIHLTHCTRSLTKKYLQAAEGFPSAQILTAGQANGWGGKQ